MALDLDIYKEIRNLYENEGYSQREIAKMLKVSRNTVKKYCDGSKVPWERQGVSGRQPYVVTEEVMEFIKDSLAADDDEGIKKQVHTAKRIFDLLEEDKGFKGDESS